MVKKSFLTLSCFLLGIAMVYAQKGEQRDLTKLQQVQTVHQINKKALLQSLQTGQALSSEELASLRSMKSFRTVGGAQKSFIVPDAASSPFKRSTVPALTKELIDSNPSIIRRDKLELVKVRSTKD
ncbi:MAG: hypothetical protein AAGA10_23655 [Bacteroidota bacterium]